MDEDPLLVFLFNKITICIQKYRSFIRTLRKLIFVNIVYGGAGGIRTPDLVIANDALSQLSYSP